MCEINVKSSSIRYFLHGDRSDEALVFIGGPGPSLWAPLSRELQDRRFLLTIDFLHPNPPQFFDFLEDVPTLAAHIERIVDAEKIRRIGVAAWSLGVRVGAALCGRLKDRVLGSVLLCGTAGHMSEEEDATRRLTHFTFANPMPAAADWFLAHADRILRLRARAAPLQYPSRIAKRFGLLDSLTDDDAFDALADEFLNLDFKVYRRYTEAMAKFDASAVLFQSTIPHLAVAGEKDALVPPARVRAMAVKIPRCEYFEVKSGTHYLPVEYGELLALKIDDFFDRVKRT